MWWPGLGSGIFIPRRTVPAIRHGHIGRALWVGPQDGRMEVVMNKMFWGVRLLDSVLSPSHFYTGTCHLTFC